jgi:hypothetical protein
MNMQPRKIKQLVLGVLVSIILLTIFFRREHSKNESNRLPSMVSSSNSAQPAKQQSSQITVNAPSTNQPILVKNLSGTDTNHSQRPAIDILSPQVLKQISALEDEKANRTPAEQKIDSQILYAIKMRRGLPVAAGVPAQRVNLQTDSKNRVLVDITATVTDALLNFITNQGGQVINDFPQYRSIRASILLAQMETLTARNDVQFIQPATRAFNNSVDSEGDYTHQAITARSTFSANGSDLKIGVLSDSVDYLTNSQIAGQVNVLTGQGNVNSGGEGEGTAMLEIVNDLDPGAQLYFATGEGGDAAFANNILQLKSIGCNIIVDDMLYNDEPPFQDGIVAQAVNTVTANGVLFFSSASNAGNKDAGTSGTWEGDFVDSGLSSGVITNGRIGAIHSFGSANYDRITGTGPGGSQLEADLFWSDPQGASSNDYDIYVLDSTAQNVVASSTNPQNGSQNPYESIGSMSTGEYIIVVLYSGVSRFLHLSTGRGELSISTQGSTRGHDCATNAFDVAAINAFTNWDSHDSLGPYPNAFTGGTNKSVEDFSSDGPRRVFFQADGTPITPGNYSSTGGTVRQKPDLTAANGVTTDVPGFAPFFGTSAAAPHAAAIAALLKSYNPNLSPAQIRTVLTNSTLDIMASGWDRDSGNGILMPLIALGSVEPDITRITDSLNNTSPHTGDTVTVSIVLTNKFCGLAGNSVGSFHVGFYFSSTPSFSGSTAFYETPVSGCTANGTVSVPQNVLISSGTSPGTYYLGYRIDDENETVECDTGDKGIFYWTVNVLPPPQPDMTLFASSLNNTNPVLGATINTSITITNEPCTGGSTDASPFHVGIYWATNVNFSGASLLGEVPVPGCPANGTTTLIPTVTINTNTTPGKYYLGFKIDDENEINECNEGNNGIYYWTLNVAATTSPAPTLKINAANNSAILIWPTNLSGYVLQYSTNLYSGNWFTNPAVPSVVNGQFTVTNRPISTIEFFRLIK